MYESLLAREESAESASGYLLMTVGRNLGHGGVFDYQRRGNMLAGYRQFRDFKHVSNFNIGLFAQQAGLTLEEALGISGRFASMFSKNAQPDQPYGLDPEDTDYIRRGFAAGQSGMFDQQAERR
jgi:hypothetical protein